MILSGQTIRRLCQNCSLVVPFYERTVQWGKTYGLSTAGYDVRVDLGDNGEICIMPSGTFLLAATLERFNMPMGVMGIVHDKSSWARQGLTVQNTVIEPGWRGYLTLELTNHSDRRIRIRQGEPIAQIVFHFLDENAEQPYDGKYQDQERGPQKAIEESS